MKALVYITLKNGVLDPQGEAVAQALHSLEFNEVKDIRQGKYFEINIEGKSKLEAEKNVKLMCEKLLANTVIENYRFEIKE